LRREYRRRYLDLKRRKLYNDKIHSLYYSPNNVRVIKSRRIRLVGHVACMEKGEMSRRFWLGGPKGRDHWKELGLYERKILIRWTLGR
jgi:hypothetical protein